jgi:cytochrome c oxidase assembly protein subunit 11
MLRYWSLANVRAFATLRRASNIATSFRARPFAVNFSTITHTRPPYTTRSFAQPLLRPTIGLSNNAMRIQPTSPILLCLRRNYVRPSEPQRKQSNRTSLLYILSIAVFFLGLTYAAVPLYRLFCSVTGFGGTTQVVSDKFSPENLVPRRDARRIRVTFNADVSQALPWSFHPQQREVYVYPGETALVFYTAKNNSDRDLVGISTYNVTPNKAGAYFNKIQCFCFEEQILRAGEEVDMPIFFFIDPDIVEEPQMRDVDTITLSYTFFNAKRR